MARVSATLPCYRRMDQTIENYRRLLHTADYNDVLYYLVVSQDDWAPFVNASPFDARVKVIVTELQLTYWNSLELVRLNQPECDLYVGLANDLLPGRSWLERGVNNYVQAFGNNCGMMGFNDGIHTERLSPHFLIGKELLTDFGGWPVHYRHTFGDVELCERAIKLGCYRKSSWAVLYHNHAINGAKWDNEYRDAYAADDSDRVLWWHRQKELGL